jgi:hypothetical protein
MNTEHGISNHEGKEVLKMPFLGDSISLLFAKYKKVSQL